MSAKTSGTSRSSTEDEELPKEADALEAHLYSHQQKLAQQEMLEYMFGSDVWSILGTCFRSTIITPRSSVREPLA